MEQGSSSGKLKSERGLICPKCHRSRLSRTARKGFWQNRIMAWFGYYPWKCRSCRKTFMIRKRHEEGAHTSHRGSQHAPRSSSSSDSSSD